MVPPHVPIARPHMSVTRAQRPRWRILLRRSARSPQTPDQVAGVDAEHLGQLEDVVQRGVALSPLDLAHVTPVEARLLRELLLALAELVTPFADPFTELARRLRQGFLGHDRSDYHASGRCIQCLYVSS